MLSTNIQTANAASTLAMRWTISKVALYTEREKSGRSSRAFSHWRQPTQPFVQTTHFGIG
jgi:hypothetical protein